MGSLSIQQITKKYDETQVLHSITLDIDEGELVTLVGPSGSGKTTLLRILAGLLEPSSGEIRIDGKSTEDMTSTQRGAVIVFQDYALFPHMNVLENISFGLKVRGVPKRERMEKAMELIQLLDMKGLEDRYPSALSGGQRQRVAIARALAIEPNVLLLDEPFSSLDTNLKNSMRSLIIDLQKKLKITTILVTHDRREALMVSDRVAVLMNGRIIQFDQPEEIYEKPATKEIADFFGDNNTLEARAESGMVMTPFGLISAPVEYEGPVYLVFRREAICLCRLGEMPIMRQCSNGEMRFISGTIEGTTYTGGTTIYNVLTDAGQFQAIQASKASIKEGEIVNMHISEVDISLYRMDTGERL